MVPTLSVIIPTLNAEATLPSTFESLSQARRSGLITEVIVTDGGSDDGTRQIARGAGARVVEGSRGRGTQLRRGILASSGLWLMVLHADTRLQPGWETAVCAHMARPGAAGLAGYGRLRFDDDRPAARRIETLAMVRAKYLGLPYGDQALLISRALYDAVGGFPAVPLMEDVALVRALGRRRLRALDFTALTSAERYRRDGWLVRPLRNLCCLLLYRAGVKPHRLVRFYHRTPPQPRKQDRER